MLEGDGVVFGGVELDRGFGLEAGFLVLLLGGELLFLRLVGGHCLGERLCLEVWWLTLLGRRGTCGWVEVGGFLGDGNCAR